MSNPGGLDMAQLAGADAGTRVPEGPPTGGAQDQSLHAEGHECFRCHATFGADTPARRTASGEVIRDTCPAD